MIPTASGGSIVNCTLLFRYLRLRDRAYLTVSHYRLIRNSYRLFVKRPYACLRGTACMLGEVVAAACWRRFDPASERKTAPTVGVLRATSVIGRVSWGLLV